MKMNKFVLSERLKTIILIVLFISTLLLSYLYLHGDTFTGLGETVNSRLSSTEFSTDDGPDLGELVNPESVSVSFGDGCFDVFKANATTLWNEFLPIYISFTEMNNLMIEEISSAQWNESMEFSSIVFNFGCDISNEFFEGQGASNYGQNDFFTSISSIGCSQAGETAVFVRNKTQNRYFRISADSEFFDLEGTLAALRADTTASGRTLLGSEANDSYYPTYMLIGSDSRAYIPYETSLNLKPLRVSEQPSENAETSLAETFFGKGLNFIRKITDNNGTITYMYGYNQKALSFGPDGHIEYTDNTTDSESQLNYNNALKAALAFISSHGTWSNTGRNTMKYSLRKATTGTSGRSTVYRFCFKAASGSYPLYSGDEFDIVVELTGDKVTYYRRNLLSMPFMSVSTDTGTAGENSPIYSILAENYPEIGAIMADSGSQLLFQSETYGGNMEEVMSRLESVIPGYYRTDDSSLVPAWVCRFDSCYVFFDLYSGAFLGSIKAGEY